ncbi:hypothetical protein Tdes44962_MAKER07318 [Teratosphaeria destructans]|uniref:Uncharacterized protein n=1 Tax=Teratosphaeria destructans TaxID=418781 RepID=A0A9W7SZB4_9PEZI|nr:hypothetical protein Tdes44962_MAKER07318 [Teratosphaeria destructans]
MFLTLPRAALARELPLAQVLVETAGLDVGGGGNAVNRVVSVVALGFSGALCAPALELRPPACVGASVTSLALGQGPNFEGCRE